MIIAPLVVAAIYDVKHEYAFLCSAFFTVDGMLVMFSLSCRKDAKDLGKEKNSFDENRIEKKEQVIKMGKLEDIQDIHQREVATEIVKPDTEQLNSNNLSTSSQQLP